MSLKSVLLLAALIALPLPAAITGTFLPAIDGTNSFRSSDGTSAFSDTTATPGLWHDRPIFAIQGLSASGTYQGQNKPGADTHTEIVTTIDGLTPGKDYEVRMVMGVAEGNTGNQHIDAGFQSGALTTLLEGGGTPTGLALEEGGSWKAYEQAIGTATADAEGEIQVYVDATAGAERSVYLGLSYRVAPPPPGFIVERTLTSPDGSTGFLLERSEADGSLLWSASHAGKTAVTRGALGIDLSGIGTVADEGDITAVDSRSVDTSWTPVYGEHSEIRDHFTEETLTLDHPDHGALQVRLQVRAYDGAVALRYLIDGSGELTTPAERTSFPLPATAQAWVTGNAQGAINKVAVGAIGGSVERPLTAELGNDLFVALGEAGQRRHARMKFSRSGTSTLVPSLSGNSTHTDSLVTPWRYVRLATTPAGLLQGNPLLLNLSDPSEIDDPSWIRPGKVLREVTLTTQGGIACVDWAAEHGVDFVHFDAGWYGNEYNSGSDATTVTVDPNRSPGPLELRQIIDYAASKGIGVILYVNRRALETQLDEILPLYQSWGVAGIKFGFVNVGSQYWTEWLHDAIAACAEHELMVDVHDEYRMTGVERTLPNFMTAEGVRGDEESPPSEMAIRTIFTRGLAGAADHTNCYFASRVDTMGSHGAQLAKSVCLYSPWQYLYWYDRPPGSPGVGGAGSTASVLEDVPELSFFERLPATWDETRWLDGHPDTHATVARRRGDVWFIGALNANANRDFEIPLDFLEDGQNYRLELFRDDPAVETTTRVRIDTTVVDRHGTIEQAVAPRHGFSAILTPTDDPLPPPPPPTTSMIFRHGADVASDDGLFDAAGYLGVDDTSLLQESPDASFGGRENLIVGVLGDHRVRTSLLRFDLSPIAGHYASVEAMTLRLHVDGIGDPAAAMTLQVGLERAGNADWVAGSGDGQPENGAASWNHAVRSGAAWLGGADGARGADDLHGILATTTLSAATAPVGSWLEIPLAPIPGEVESLTEMVDLWTANDGNDNAGLLLAYRFPVIAGTPEWAFSSSDHPDPALRPQLVVNFVPADPYGRWIEQSGLPGDDIDPTGDPDGDGLPNALECLVGGNPSAPDGEKRPLIRIGATGPEYHFRTSLAGLHLRPRLEFSDDLAGWRRVSPDDLDIQLAAGLPDPDGTQTVVASLPAATHTSGFVRISLTLP